jgi:hypothetical protein
MEDQALMGCHLDKRPDASAKNGTIGAKKMGAVTIALPTCHMAILQEPAGVAEVIEQAARKALTE